MVRLLIFSWKRSTFGELKRLNRIRTFSSFCTGFRLNKAIFGKVQITSFLLKKRVCCLCDTYTKLLGNLFSDKVNPPGY